MIELDYLLRHVFEEKDGIAPAEGSVAQTLNEIRDGLQKIIADNAKAPDLTGDVTRKNLVLLKWDNWIVDEVIATLNGSKLYKATLDALPLDLDLPDNIPDEPDAPKGLKQKVSYDAATKELRFTGPMTKAERDTLLSLSTDPAYQSAVNALFDAPRLFVSQKMKAFELPPFEAPLEALPQSVVFAPELKGRIYYDAEAKKLRFTGWMTETEKEKLLALSDDADYAAAISILFDAPGAFVPVGKNVFLTQDDAAELFDAGTEKPAMAEERFGFVLDKLLPYIRRVLSESLVKQKLGDALKLEAQTSERLLMQWLNSPKHPDQKSITEFLAPIFAESNANVNLTAAAFPDQFETYVLLHKIAMLVEKFKLTPEQVRWVFDYGPEVGWLDLNTLPFAPVAADAEQYARWERLADLFALRDQLPLGEALLSRIFMLARTAGTSVDELLHELSERTGWKEEDLQSLTGVQGFGLNFPDAYKDERALGRLKACFVTLRRLGVSASQVTSPDSGWIKPEMTPVEARSIKQAVKAKYEDEQWLTIAKPLKDILREKQRSALVSFLVFKIGYDNANDLFAHFLVDVEMSPCAMTSRVKQASGSIQLFVQRCLMGLEKDAAKNTIALDEETARQWKWRKNYRVWEANRKVFLYPENWIEPELRDDKSPFFKDLENQLLQNEVTKDTAEDAFLNYLEKLNDVARLDIVGMYHQVEFVPHPGGEKEVTLDILHVFGRTRGKPRIYYYRQRIGSSPSSYHWTSWEKVDVDIEEDHLIPVIWNRRLHIFWPIFTEKAKDEPPPVLEEGETTKPSKPSKYWEIQIAWSEYKNKKWSAKRVSSKPLALPSGSHQPAHEHLFRIFFIDGNPVIRGYSWSKSEAHPEHPRSFPVFEFRFTGCDGEILSSFDLLYLEDIAFQPVLGTTGSYPENLMFVEDPKWTGDHRLYLVEGDYPFAGSIYDIIEAKKDIPVLNLTPNTFRLLVPHQDEQFFSQRPLFYQDDTRTLYVS